jgi:hypothetical protein
MASESTARVSDPAATSQVESPSMPESGRRPEQRGAAAPEAQSAVTDVEVDGVDFEAHDTIPAPPWHDDADAPSAPEHTAS